MKNYADFSEVNRDEKLWSVVYQSNKDGDVGIDWNFEYMFILRAYVKG